MIRIFATLLLIANLSSYAENDKKLNIDALKSDLSFFRDKLEHLHPNLYLYTPKQFIDASFDSLLNSITEPMSELEFYKHISIISSIIKDGHTVLLPSNKTTSYHNTNSKFFPYKLKLLNNHLYAEMVLTNNPTITEGMEITAINGIYATTIVKQLTERQVRDGYNQTYPSWIVDNYFREYYSYIFGHPNQFDIQYIDKGVVKQTIVEALPKDSIAYYKKLKYPTQTNSRMPYEGIIYKNYPDLSYACLTIKDFHKDVLKETYKQDFTAEIKKAFEHISSSNTKNLILDLRNNQGGDIEYGVYLLSYLINEDFRVVDQYYKVSTLSGQLSKATGEALGIHHPKDICFKGQLYILINGGSFSNSGIVASILKQHNRGVFIGNETGGNAKVLAGYVKEFNLPNSSIHIEIPTRQFMLNEQMPLSGHGTIPDFDIIETIDDVLNNKDAAKDFAIKLISNNKTGQ